MLNKDFDGLYDFIRGVYVGFYVFLRSLCNSVGRSSCEPVTGFTEVVVLPG